jgi:hypothetical protein
MITLPSITWGACYDIAHLLFSTRLKAAFKNTDTHTCRHSRATAHDALPSDHLWSVRERHTPLLLPASLLPAQPTNAHLSPQVRCQMSITRELALAPCPASENVSARDRRCCAGPPAHLNPYRCSLTVRTPLLHLRYLDAAVYPSLCVLSGKLRYATVCLGDLPRCMGSVLIIIFRFASPGRLSPYLFASPSLSAAGGASSISCLVAKETTRAPGRPDHTDLWLDLMDLASCKHVASSRERQALQVYSFAPAFVCRFCMRWLLAPFCFFSACPRHLHNAVC